MPNSYELSQEKARAFETFELIDTHLGKSFNLDAFGTALQKPDDTKVRLEAYEHSLPYTRMPQLTTTLYGNAGYNGIVAAPLNRLDIAGAGTTYDKREDLHDPCNNYKIHGARFAVLHTLNDLPEARIMATASAGNHGISLAVAVNQVNRQLGGTMQREAHIYCRENISPAKKELLQALGATVFANYETLEDAMDVVGHLAERDANYTFIHPFNNPLTIAGQATIEFETFAALKSMGVDLRRTPFRRYIPVGGGGYLAGTAYAWDKLRQWGVIGFDSQLIGVEVERNDSMARTLDGRPSLRPHSSEVTDGPDTLDTDSDGTATLRPGANTLAITREYTDGIRVIPKEYLVRACGILTRSHNGKAPELAGSLSLGGLLYDIDQREGSEPEGYRNLTTTTGGNITAELLHRLSNEWLDTQCDIRTKIAVLSLKTAAERVDAIPVQKPQGTPSSKPASRRGAQGNQDLRVWKGHVQR